MNKKVSKEIILMLIGAAILAGPSLVLQNSHAQSNANLQDSVLNMHNRERSEVKVSPLTWSTSIAAESQAYANQLKSQGYVCNAQRCDMLPHGANNENLAWGSVGYPLSGMIQSWIDEKSRYDGGPIPNGGGPAGHYTAMVWHNTREVGCGTASGAQIEILVCRYNPPGNFIGQRPFEQGAAQAVGEEVNGAPPFEQGAAPPDEIVDNRGGVDNSTGGGN